MLVLTSKSWPHQWRCKITYGTWAYAKSNCRDIARIATHWIGMGNGDYAHRRCYFTAKTQIAQRWIIKGDRGRGLRLPALEQDDNGGYIRAEMLEKSFYGAGGYRSLRDLPAMPNDLAFYAKVLLLREWVHHLDFDKFIWVNCHQYLG